jgi:hypothetical protein
MIEIVAHKKIVTCPIQNPSNKVRRVSFLQNRIWAGLSWFELLWQLGFINDFYKVNPVGQWGL